MSPPGACSSLRRPKSLLMSLTGSLQAGRALRQVALSAAHRRRPAQPALHRGQLPGAGAVRRHRAGECSAASFEQHWVAVRAGRLQECGLVPIVEPELMIEGKHDMQVRSSLRLGTAHLQLPV